ncbi:MAG: hypothetical protein IIB77_12235 [Proteobacteria bacterium]|nr:hypothetical protein [Pseudomonadota bacterium]
MTEEKKDGMDRRNFLRSTAAVSAGLLWTPVALGQVGAKKVDDINIAMIGVGRQGKILLHLMLKVPGIQVKAVCDIWSYGQRIGKGFCLA